MYLRVARIHTVHVEFNLHAHGWLYADGAVEGAAAVDQGAVVLQALSHEPLAIVGFADVAFTDVAKGKAPAGRVAKGRAGLPYPVADHGLEASHLHAISQCVLQIDAADHHQEAGGILKGFVGGCLLLGRSGNDGDAELHGVAVGDAYAGKIEHLVGDVISRAVACAAGRDA